MAKHGLKVKSTTSNSNTKQVKNDKVYTCSVSGRILESRGIKVTFINKKEVVNSNVSFIAIYKPRRSPIML